MLKENQQGYGGSGWKAQLTEAIPDPGIPSKTPELAALLYRWLHVLWLCAKSGWQIGSVNLTQGL